ncbi:MAG: alpha/beta fold hydrolase [Armatimonadota bacterium]
MEYLNRFPQMLQINLMRRVREVEAEANQRRRAMRTKKDALAYQEALRRKIRKCFGPLPRRTPLNPVIMGEIERDRYRIEKLLFESRPGLPVTALLYVPKGRRFPLPGVLAPCGHSWNGKAAELYQAFCQGLATKGYVVLQYDPISQGERIQYPDGKGGSRYGGCCNEHNEMGKQQILLGEFFGTWRVWDGIRALDYLLSREEVDAAHVGLTGNSGGGTLTTWLAANDDRFTMAAPGCYVTTWRRNAENELPADSEQQPPFALAQGLDTEDFFGLHAPKPLLLLTQEFDFFDQRGAVESFERLKRLYTLLGAPDNVAMVTGPDHHGYAKPLREAMYGFFNRACGKTRETAREPAINIEPDEKLYVTKTGQVHDLKRRTVFSFTAEESQALAAKRKHLSGEPLRRALARLLNLPKRQGVPDYRILRQLGRRDGYPRPFVTCYVVETEPDIQAIVYKLEDEARHSRPVPGKSAALYLPHVSSDEDLQSEPLVRQLARDAEAFFAMDYRGVGESRPNTCGQKGFYDLYGNDYFYASYQLMLGEPYVGRRAHDVLSVLDWLESYGHARVHLAGRGWGSVPAAFAALLDPRVKQVTLKNAPLSFAEWAETENAQWPLSSCLPHVLRTLDLPDCYRELRRKRLRILQPWDAEMKRMSPVRARVAATERGVPLAALK